MFTLACEQVLNFWVRKCQPIKTLIRLFSHVKKYRTTNQNAHTTNFTCEKYSMQLNTNFISAEYYTYKSLCSYDKIQYNKNSFQHGKIVQYKKTKTDLQDCRVGVTIGIDKDNNHL